LLAFHLAGVLHVRATSNYLHYHATGARPFAAFHCAGVDRVTVSAGIDGGEGLGFGSHLVSFAL
jgi:hypothetical protein